MTSLGGSFLLPRNAVNASPKNCSCFPVVREWPNHSTSILSRALCQAASQTEEDCSDQAEIVRVKNTALRKEIGVKIVLDNLREVLASICIKDLFFIGYQVPSHLIFRSRYGRSGTPISCCPYERYPGCLLPTKGSTSVPRVQAAHFDALRLFISSQLSCLGTTGLLCWLVLLRSVGVS